MSCHATSCHVMSRHVPHVTSCHVMSRHVMSCHVMTRHVMSRHVTSCHVMSRLAPSCHVMPRNVMSRHVISRHVTSCYVISRRKSRDGHTTNASLSTDFFHTQLIQIRHDRVRWLSRRLPIPYRISGIWSSYILNIKYKHIIYVFFALPYLYSNIYNSIWILNIYLNIHISKREQGTRWGGYQRWDQ